MSSNLSRKKLPVRRLLAERYLLIALIGYAASVLGVRLFLELTNYPRVEFGSLHIAHVIWGGLFLFVAALLPLMFANRWALFWSALLSGIGFGLFIDEIGKFITQSNDYFYPPRRTFNLRLFPSNCPGLSSISQTPAKHDQRRPVSYFQYVRRVSG
ncbi:MAG: hypothetical protein AB1522_06760 [Chloroflexota bacterium]